MTYISDIAPATPTGLDFVKNGDDQIRQLKTDLKNTLGGLDGVIYEDADKEGNGGTVLLSAQVMNSWEARIKALEASLSNPDGTSVPVGGVMIWYGPSTTFPPNWYECNGQVRQYTDGNGVTQSITLPDMRGKIPAGPGAGGINQGSTPTNQFVNGVLWVDSNNAGAHAHTTSTPGKALTGNQVPSHAHAMFNSTPVSYSGTPPLPNLFTYVAVKMTNPNGSFAYSIAPSSGNAAANIGASSAYGAGDLHTHPNSTSSTTGNHSHITDCTPPYRGMYFIAYVPVLVTP